MADITLLGLTTAPTPAFIPNTGLARFDTNSIPTFQSYGDTSVLLALEASVISVEAVPAGVNVVFDRPIFSNEVVPVDTAPDYDAGMLIQLTSSSFQIPLMVTSSPTLTSILADNAGITLGFNNPVINAIFPPINNATRYTASSSAQAGANALQIPLTLIDATITSILADNTGVTIGFDQPVTNNVFAPTNNATRYEVNSSSQAGANALQIPVSVFNSTITNVNTSPSTIQLVWDLPADAGTPAIVNGPPNTSPQVTAVTQAGTATIDITSPSGAPTIVSLTPGNKQLVIQWNNPISLTASGVIASNWVISSIGTGVPVTVASVTLSAADTITLTTTDHTIGEGYSLAVLSGVIQTLGFTNLASSNPYVGVSVAPTLSSAVALDARRVRIVFSKEMDPVSVSQSSNYSIPGLTINSVVRENSKTVLLNTSVQAPGQAYTLTVSNIRDIFENLVA